MAEVSFPLFLKNALKAIKWHRPPLQADTESFQNLFFQLQSFKGL